MFHLHVCVCAECVQGMLRPEEEVALRMESQLYMAMEVLATGTQFSGRAAFSYNSEPPASEVLTFS